MADKMWGDEPFWGLGYEWDPNWVLTDKQKELRELLISLCEQEMRANAKRSDDELVFPPSEQAASSPTRIIVSKHPFTERKIFAILEV